MAETIESWIDYLAVKVFGSMTFQGQAVKSFRLFEKNEYPETLEVFPCWIHYIEHLGESPIGSAGASWLMWQGVSELHFSPQVSKANYPDMLNFYTKTLTAVLANRTLGGLVSYFMLGPGTKIEGPVALQYGLENEHPGLIVHWVVKEDISGKFTLGN
jgi:hypothetical protein